METTKQQVEKLAGILEMIDHCNRRIQVQKNMLQTCQWIFNSKGECEQRISDLQYIRRRLKKYYAKKVFALASDAYKMTEPLLKVA